MRLIVAGSRSFTDYDLLKAKLDYFLQNTNDVVIVSGTSNGADKLGEKYAEEKGYGILQCPADWDKHGKKAGFIRNTEMAVIGTHCVVFWDGVSRGSESMITICESKNIPCRVVLF